jgi:5-methylcytosine-specific restriction endonuclease McrA
MTYDFIQNKYTKIYFQLMEKRRNFPLSKKDVYCETHHIIPKSLGGSDTPDNLVNLTAREHFIAHRLLTKMTEGVANRSMWWAVHRLCYSNNNSVHHSKDYEKIRLLWAEFMKENHHSKRIPGWSRKMSEIVTKDWEDNEQKRIIVGKAFSKSHKKRKNEDPDEYYKTQTKNAKKGGAAISMKWKEDPEWAKKEKENMSKRVSGKNNPMFGKTLSEERKAELAKQTSNKRWISNENETLYIDKEFIEEYLEKGYTMGRKNYKRKENR